MRESARNDRPLCINIVSNHLLIHDESNRLAKTELEDAGLDTEGMATSVASLRKELEALAGVDIMLNDDTFKESFDIFDGIAEKWGELKDIQKATITELVAGTDVCLYVQKCA